MANDQFTDDSSIPDDARLWRRVPPWHFIFDDNLGRVRPSKAAFDDDENGSPMSVVLADLVLESGRGPEHILIGHDRFALAEITAGLARSKQQGIVRDPVPEEPTHALVFGKKTASVTRALAKGSVWVVPPPAGSLPRQP
jgi:hypothetical protein